MDDTPTKEAAATGSPEGPGTDPEEDRIVVLSTLDFPIVGIGASAGGLAALARFFEAMPARNGMAFVVVLHLSPSHESHASEILQRSTRMPVSQVRDSAPIEADHVYVIPPGQQLTLSDGHLQLTETERVKGRPVAIDIFFRTLAQVHRTRAVSIVLSGVGSDGAVGLADVKEHGGITIAQAPEDAEQDGMPRAAISTGLIDFVLPVVEMPQKLIDLWANARAIQLPADVADSVRAEPPASLDAAREAEKALQEIMALVQTRTRHDFRHYKRATILRRIERRLQVRSVPHLPAYRDQLHQDPSETRALLQDLLISVTNFFRDRLAFEALERDVLPTLVKELEPGEDLRAWTPGCATGEEAYSLAMLLHEALGVREPAAGFQIFATDIDERAIAIARKGAYPGAIVTDVAPVRLRAYFNAAGEQFQVKKQVRDHVLFASHNVLRDPPFSRLHLICCRNLLIYLDREAQARILETFRASLLPGGLLFLGSSESAEALPQAFTAVDKKHRIYRVNHSAARPRVPPLIVPAPALHRAGAATEERRKVRPVDLHARALERFSAPSVLVDADHNVLHVANGAGRYFEMGSGVPSHNLVANIAAPLRLELRTALLKVKLGDGGVEARRIRVDRPEGPVFVDLTVRTFKDDHTGAELTLVTFDEVPAVDDGALGRPAGVSHGGADAAIHLEAEIVRLKEQIQDVVEHADISTEELKSSNEELQAINEELRSATEELETSKEELQSTNEELVTVNYELAAKIEESGKAKDDLQNMIASIDIATIFIDGAMRIQRYTPRAAELFNLIAGDIGRSLLDITHKLDYDELAHDAEQAFKQLRTVEREVAGTDGRTFLARLLPYRTEGDRIEGAVLNFVDISALRDVERRLEVGEEALRVAAATTKDFAIMTLDEAGLVTTWNAGAVRIFGYSTAEIVGQPAAVIFTPEDRAAGVPEQEIGTARATGRAEDDRWHQRKDGTQFYCSGVMTRLEGRNLKGYAKIARDMTGVKRAELARDSMLLHETTGRKKAEAAIASKEEFLAVMSHELKHPLNLIHVNAELLMRQSAVRDSDAATRAAETIRRAVAGQAKVIDDLLDLSRARTGKLTLQPAPVDWVDVIRHIFDSMQPDAQARAIDFSFAHDESSLVTTFDPVRAEQVVWNLLHNALKFTPPDGSVRARLARIEGFVVLSIADTGKGIDPAFVDQVFEMFSQESGPRRRQEGGLGVGLALVREIATAHGGRVAAESAGIGQGSTFTVWLPEEASEMPGGAANDESKIGLDGLRILFVDDSEDTLWSFSMLLEAAGALVVAENSGAAALERIAQERFDVIISDIGMPEMDGYELMAKARLLPNARGAIAIACSGYAREQDAHRAREAGYDAHVAKPVALKSIEREIARLRP